MPSPEPSAAPHACSTGTTMETIASHVHSSEKPTGYGVGASSSSMFFTRDLVTYVENTGPVSVHYETSSGTKTGAGVLVLHGLRITRIERACDHHRIDSTQASTCM